MFGTIIACIIAAYAVLANDANAVLALEGTLGFLWVWHWIWAGVFAIIAMILVACGGVFSVGGDTGNERVLGLGMIAIAPFLLVSSVLYLVGVWAVDTGLQDGAIVDQNKFVIGCVLYGLALLNSLRSTSSNKSSD